MNAVTDILNQLPMQELAADLGTDPETAQQAAEQAIQLLLRGMHDNTATGEGEQSLAAALSDHAQHSPFAAGGQVSLDEVDTDDGAKIVSHVLGDQQPAQFGGLGGGLVERLLPKLAPIVLGYLAGKLSGSNGSLLDDLLGGGRRQREREEQERQQREREQQRGGGGLWDRIRGRNKQEGSSSREQRAPESRPRTRSGDASLRPSSGSNGQRQSFPVDQSVDDGLDTSTNAPQQRRGGGLRDILGQILDG